MSDNDFIPQIKPIYEGVENEQKSTEDIIPYFKSVEESDEVNKIDIPVKNNKRENTMKKKGKKLIIGIIVFLFIFVLYNTISFAIITRSAKVVVNDAKAIKDALASQDFNKINESLSLTQKDIRSFEAKYKLVSWLKIIPFAGSYVRDGSNLISAASEGISLSLVLTEIASPYADLLGYSGGQVSGADETASDRIDFLVKTLPEVTPRLSEITDKLEKIDEHLEKINPDRYPVRFAGKDVRVNIESGLQTYHEFSSFLRNGKPLIEHSSYLLGLDEKRRYLILFQNDKELRPSGGFITAYSVMEVEKAKFDPTTSDDIYNLDRSYTPKVKAPDPIVDYIKGPYTVSDNLFLRDMNWSPDFGESMKLFSEEIKDLDIPEVDGIIAVDTQLLVNLIDALGPVAVAGFGNYSNEIVEECNCQQVIYELESFADIEGPIVWDPAGTGKIIYAPPNTDNRKKIIGPLMNAIMAQAFGSPKEKIPDLFDAVFKSITEKHVMLFMYDNDIQQAAEDFGIAGNVVNYDGDYLQINDANLGGRKSNLYVTQEVSQTIEESGGEVTKTLEITYQNPEKFDGWLNSVLPNWVRVYVPKGSALIDSSGLADSPDPYEDLGYTVFAGFFELRPLGVNKITLKYKLPMRFEKDFKILIQKQPGKDGILHTINIGKKSDEFILKSDKELRYKF